LKTLLEKIASSSDDNIPEHVSNRMSELERNIPNDKEISGWRKKLSAYIAEEIVDRPHLTLNDMRSSLKSSPRLSKHLRPKRIKSPKSDKDVGSNTKKFIDYFDNGVGAGSVLSDDNKWLAIGEHAKVIFWTSLQSSCISCI